jgi:nucleotide-binding universal stress UspA family protein
MTDPDPTDTASGVVVGVDGTNAALNAVRWAAAEAILRRLPLRILHAAAYADLSNPAGRSSPEAARARAILARGFTVARREQPRLAVSTELVGAGPTRALDKASATADLLVLGVSGTGGLDEMVLDSVALGVSGQGQCPVVVVRTAQRRDAGPVENLPVVVGVGADLDDSAIGWAFETARLRGARLVAVHAVSRSESRRRSRSSSSADREAESSMLDAARFEPWRVRYPEVELGIDVSIEHPADALVEWSTRSQLVVVGTRGRGPAARALLGSTSRALLRHSACPVAVIRPDVVRGMRDSDLANAPGGAPEGTKGA